MAGGIFTIFGRVNLTDLFDEWESEEVSDEYKEPSSGWLLKHAYVFSNNVCVLLFENAPEKENAYYRVLCYRGENENFELIKKIRFRETDSFRVDAISINQDVSALFVCRSNEKVSRDIYYNELNGGKLGICGKDELIEAIKNQSECRFAVVDGMSVIFISAPDGGYLMEFEDSDPYDFYLKVACDDEDEVDDDDGNDNDDGDEDGDVDDDDDGDEDDDGENIDEEVNGVSESRVQVEKTKDTVKKTAMDELNDLIGLDSIKATIRQIVAFTKVRKMAKEQGRKVEGINLNLSFLGNPGTAKTTVARLFARIMKENGVLSKGDLIEVGRSDLVAKYTGQTAIKVKSVFKKAAGNVLFIDEAYSLVDGWENGYGDEAIATIVQEMENNREDMIVIFAGYPDRMENFLSRNPGLRSRVPFSVKFGDYSADELTAIAKSEAARRGYEIGSGAERKIHDICASAVKSEEFGNGRFSRNLVEVAIMRSAFRTVNSVPSGSDLKAYFTLEPCDFAAPDNMKKEGKTRTIGFNAA